MTRKWDQWIWNDFKVDDLVLIRNYSTDEDLALKLDLFKKNLQTSLGVYDIFNTSPSKTNSYTNNIKQTQVIMPSNRYLRLSVVYIFGNNKINVKDRNLGNETEKQRAGN